MDEQSNLLALNAIELKNFRCFKEKKIIFQYPITYIEGHNGTGKTSLLEALYFAGNLRSFKTVHSKELIRSDMQGFFLKLDVIDTLIPTGQRTLKVGYTAEKKAVKLDNTLVTSFDQLHQQYRVLAITEDDVQIIQGSPIERRAFIDHALILAMPSVMPLFKQFRRVLAQRNQLLSERIVRDTTLYIVLTEQLLQITAAIQQHRKILLKILDNYMQPWVQELWGSSSNFHMEYTTRYSIDEPMNATHFLEKYPQLMHIETRYGRSLFGIHVDDITLTLQGMPARSFGSRGQQKSLIMLLKIALLQHLLEVKKIPTIFLLDDFLTDFDTQRLSFFMQLLQRLPVQLIITVPTGSSLVAPLQPLYPIISLI